ncbi:MAG: FAD-dependent oxidoreductase, partial [Dehalococcoidia bacterium]|nr:FAD-dependent oxidoreductase [Dehalococcoidia bacterium]
IAQFLSPMTNKRRDKYGGDLESRARFAVEICHRVRQEVGKDYPVLFRITVDEFIKGGLTTRDGQRIARLLVEAGVDAIDTTTAYLASSEEGYISQLVPVSGVPGSFPKGCFIHLAHAIKQAVSVPVIGVGRISDPRLADKFIREGKADMTAMGRSLIADPSLPNKAAEGRYGDIRTCIACDTCYTHVLANRSGLSCTVNPELGMEGVPLTPALKPKRVVIVGGGPGGMQAALVASSRGHKVFLLEKKDHLGGNLVPAAAASFKRETDELRRYLIVQIEKSPADVKLGVEATAEKVMRLKPEVVILANGASPLLPDIPGIRNSTVTTAVDVLSGTREPGQRVVVVGGGMVGCEAAVFLAEKGKQVTLVTRRSSDFGPAEGLAADMEAYARRWLLFELWPNLDIEIVAKSTFEEVTDKGLTVRNREGKDRLIEGDSVVFAIGFTPDSQLRSALEGKVPELYSVGDCVKPRQIIHAIREGWELAGHL